MANGQTGLRGVGVVKLAEEEPVRALEAAPILRRPMAARSALDLDPSLRSAEVTPVK